MDISRASVMYCAHKHLTMYHIYSAVTGTMSYSVCNMMHQSKLWKDTSTALILIPALLLALPTMQKVYNELTGSTTLCI